ncbi:MAG: 4Fe-4S dicluster domain-containing protein [bacterium]
MNCGRCNPVCPVDLPAQELLQLVSHQQADRAVELGLQTCIECGLCDRACPSDIPMAELFAHAKQELLAEEADIAARSHYKKRFEAHKRREADTRAAAANKRAARLQNADRWS